MSRPPALKPNEPTKTFIVAEGNIMWDNNDQRKEGGEEIELSYDQAVHFKKMGVIEVPLEDFRNEPTKPDDAAGVAEAFARPQADGSGEPDVGAPYSDPFAKAAGTDKN